MAHTHQGTFSLTIYFDSLAPYEKRVIELLRNSRDKRARKLAKKRVRLEEEKTYHSPVNLETRLLTSFPARHLRSCQEEGRRAPARHRRVPSCRPLNVTLRTSTLDKQRHGPGLRFGVI
jgi:hypothetical protein